MLAARTWPAILAGADMSRRSSIEPDGEDGTPPPSTTPERLGRALEDGAAAAACAAATGHGDQEADEHGGAAAVGRDRRVCTVAVVGLGDVAAPARASAWPGT